VLLLYIHMNITTKIVRKMEDDHDVFEMPLQDESTKDKDSNKLTAPTTLIEGGDEAIGVAHLLHHLCMFKRIHLRLWFFNRRFCQCLN